MSAAWISFGMEVGVYSKCHSARRPCAACNGCRDIRDRHHVDSFDALHEELTDGAARYAERHWFRADSLPLHACYPNGPASYYGVYAPGRWNSLPQQWDEIKRALSDVLSKHRASITHHHAVGRDHRPWYDQQRPDSFAAALAAAKRTLDPAGILNPGVLIDPMQSPRPAPPLGDQAQWEPHHSVANEWGKGG